MGIGKDPSICLVDFNPLNNNFTNYLLLDGHPFQPGQTVFSYVQDEHSAQKEDFSTNKVPMEFHQAVESADIAAFFATMKAQGKMQS